MMVGTVHVQTGSSEDAASQYLTPSSPWAAWKSARPCAKPGVVVDGSSSIVTVSKNMIIPSKMEVSTANLSTAYNYDVLKC